MQHVAGRIGERIRSEREAQGITQQALATRAGVALRTLARIEAGEDMRVGTLSRLASALGVSVSYLTGRSPEGVEA